MPKRDSKHLESTHDPAWITDEERDEVDQPVASKKRKRGAPPHWLLPLVSRYCISVQSQLPGQTKAHGRRVRCIGSVGCRTTWTTPRSQDRVLTHASTCRWVPIEWRNAAMACVDPKSSGARVETLDAAMKANVSDVGMTTTEASGSLQRTTPSIGDLASQRGTPSIGDLDGGFHQSHVKAIKMRTNSVLSMASKAGRDALDTRATHSLLVFLCSNGLSIRCIDDEWFRKFVSVLNPRYTAPHSTTLGTSLIPREAAFVRKKQIEYLQTCRNLTVSYDGGKLRRPASVYTVHVTTEDRKSILVEGDDASLISHTAKYIVELIKEVCEAKFLCPLHSHFHQQIIESIGPTRFSGMSSDNAGNTRLARQMLAELYPHVINLQDPCHKLSLAVASIGKLPEFQPARTNPN
jgi:hypothetical protein